MSLAQKDNWKEMHAFHGVMSSTFHPAEEGNLKPTRTNAKELAEKAKSWKNSKVPNGYNGKVVSPILDQLVKATADIEKAVKEKKTDAELKKMITKAHEIFHEIAEKCRE
jgi:soluble cytochrome b562